MTKNMKRMTALACAAMMIASMGITGCGKADGQTKEETKTTAVENCRSWRNCTGATGWICTVTSAF